MILVPSVWIYFNTTYFSWHNLFFLRYSKKMCFAGNLWMMNFQSQLSILLQRIGKASNFCYFWIQLADKDYVSSYGINLVGEPY